jgi:hypothetical protein
MAYQTILGDNSLGAGFNVYHRIVLDIGPTAYFYMPEVAPQNGACRNQTVFSNGNIPDNYRLGMNKT